MDRLLTLTADTGGHPVPVRTAYGKAIWSGLSWAVGEIDLADVPAAEPLRIRCATTEAAPVVLHPELYHLP